MPGPPGDPQKISNRYTEEVRWEILLLEPVNDWFLGLCKNAPAVADKVEQAIDELAIWGPQLGRPLVGRTLEWVVRGSDPARGGTLCVVSTREPREGAVMKAVRWEDTKQEIRQIEPGWDTPDRVAERERSRAEMRAEQRGYQLAQLRKNSGLTQAQVAALMGVTQARVSQIEHGRITEVDAIRGYVEALGGTVDVIARVGDWTIKVA
jgi:predicted XRE-type DNA-binding protein